MPVLFGVRPASSIESNRNNGFIVFDGKKRAQYFMCGWWLGTTLPVINEFLPFKLHAYGIVPSENKNRILFSLKMNNIGICYQFSALAGIKSHIRNLRKILAYISSVMVLKKN